MHEPLLRKKTMNQPTRLFGINIDPIRMSDAVDRLLSCVRRADGECRYVVTPNVDHVRLLQQSDALRRAYADAEMVLADGMPLVWASRLLGSPLPERVTGADLVPALFDASNQQRPLRVYLLGAAPGVAERAAKRISHRWPAVRVVGTLSPVLGGPNNGSADETILRDIAAAAPDVLVLGLGAPKQELWVHEHRARIRASVALCVGATIDFLAGEKYRAWRWVGLCGMEWFHRLLCEPRRLARRYACDAWIFPQLVWRQWRSQPRDHGNRGKLVPWPVSTSRRTERHPREVL